MDGRLTTLTIASALTALRAGEFSAASLTDACLRQIERLDRSVNAFITPTPEAARRQAEQVDILVSRRPPNLDQLALQGIPLAFKDLFETAGVRTTAGSRFFADYVPREDACVVSKAKLAGAVSLGKTNTHEVALGLTGVNPHYGAVHNPWNLERISGGSSSGSAAAVAAGMCLGALGSDTGGSVRVPAALCGVVGLKPTYGRVSLRGVIPLSWNLDHVGVLTHTARDAAILLQVLAGYDPHDPASAEAPVDDYLVHLEAGVVGWHVALAVGNYVEASDPEVTKMVNEAAKVFRDLGAEVEKVGLDWLEQAGLANGRMVQADAAAFHRQRLAEHPDGFGEDVRQRLETGAALSSADYAIARRTQAEMRRRFETFFTKYDLLLLPTTPVSAPPIEGARALEAARQLTRFTSAFNLTGLPALSIPCGLTAAGLPIGVQIVSKAWGEAQVLQAGQAFQQATDWHQRHPEI